MAAGQFRTEVPTMTQAAGHVAQVNAGIQGDLTRLMGQLEPLLGTWQGTASTTFHGVKERWNTNAMRLNEALLAISEQLATSSTNYATTEETNTSAFSQISGQL